MQRLCEMMAAMMVTALAGAASLTTDLLTETGESTGQARVWNDAQQVYVEVMPAAAWAAAGAQLHMARTAAAIPQKNGNPTPGKFTVKRENGPWRAAFPLGTARPGDTVAVAVHAKMCTSGGTETWTYTDGILTNMLLIAGGYAPAALVTYAVQNGQLVVTIETLWGWLIDGAHVYVGDVPPVDPTPENFPFIRTADDIPDPVSDSFTIPLPVPTAAVTPLCIATHVDVLYLYGYDVNGDIIMGEEEGWVGAPPYTTGPAFFCLNAAATGSGGGGGEPREEGVWAAGLPFPGKNWATYILYTVE